MRIKLYTKKNEISEAVRIELEEELVSNGYELTNKDDFDLGVSIGGDGKFISMIHDANFDTKKKYLGINTGNLGYLTTYNKDSIVQFINDLKSNNFVVDKYGFINIKITSNDEYNGSEYNALNELTIRNTLLKTLYLTTFINSTMFYNFSGDGLVVSTPVGSTAYNMSVGGPMVDYTTESLVITPLAPLNNNVYKNITSSFITSDKNKIIIKPINKDNSITLVIDGKTLPIKDLISVEITCDKKISVLKDVDYNHITNLNNKIYK